LNINLIKQGRDSLQLVKRALLASKEWLNTQEVDSIQKLEKAQATVLLQDRIRKKSSDL
jgi:hypothetical protein